MPACIQNIDIIKEDLNNLKSDSYKAKQEMSQAKSDIAELSKSVTALSEKMAAEAKNEPLASYKESQAALYAELTELSLEMQTLRGLFDESKHFGEKSLKQSAQNDQMLLARVEDLEKALKDVRAKLASLEEAAKAASSSPVSAEGAPAPSGEEKAYEDAYRLFTEKKYDEAREKFSAFVKLYSGHRLAGNARFWIAETHFAQKDYESAILAYEDLMKKHKDNPKLPSAMYKQGLAFLEIGDKRAGAAILKELIEKHPDSEHAKTAAKKLRETGEEPPKPAKPAQPAKPKR